VLAEHDPPISTDTPYEERHAVVEALQELPLMQRKAVVLRHLIGLSVSETADALGIAEGTVKSHTSRGLSALEKALTRSAAD
jgi:RNA polymerase sigma factor (sigma-70 family)